MKYTNLLYFVLSAFILFFGGKLLLSGEGKTATNICILSETTVAYCFDNRVLFL